MDETLDWMDEFDDSVFNDTVEANDSSELTGFDNTETETETISPLEADTNVTNNDVTQPSGDDFFTNFTPTINFSMARTAGPSPKGGNNNNDYGPQLPDKKPEKPSGGLPGLGGGSYKDWADKNFESGDNDDNDTDDDDTDIDLDDYYGGGKTDGDDDNDDDYGSWTDKDRLEAAKEIADAAGKEAAAAAAETKLTEQNIEESKKDLQKKMTITQKAKDDFEELKQAYDTYEAYKNGANLSEAEMGKAGKIFEKYGLDKAFDGVLDGGVFGVNINNNDTTQAKKEFIDNTENKLTELEEKYNKAKEAEKNTKNIYNNSIAKAETAKTKAKEALEKAQAAKDKIGTLAAEAAEATRIAEEKQKEWEQKQKELEDAEAAEAAEAAEKGDHGNNTSTGTNSAVNNTTTFNLSESLAKAGAKMTEKEYGQVADFVAKYPGLASIIDGGLTNVEKSAVGNVIAGIQAINAGNYLTAVKEFAQGFGMTLISAFQLISTKAYGLGPRILGIIKSFMENENINYDNSEDFKTFKQMRDEYDNGNSSELQALYKTAKGTTDQKQTFDYMKDNAATSVGEYNEGLVEDVNKVVSDASRKVIHYSPYVLEAVKKWR